MKNDAAVTNDSFIKKSNEQEISRVKLGKL